MLPNGTASRLLSPERLVERAGSFGDELISLRRKVHQHPELGFEETVTASVVRDFLSEHVEDAAVSEIGGTGLLVEAGSGDQPTILLRACLDALPISERGGASYASLVDGKSHACGHDGQVAILAGALRLLAEDPPPATVFGLFQPAEEIDAGARAVLDDGLMDRVRPDLVLGFHGHPGLRPGTIGVKAGPVMASITTLRCEVVGREGHGAEPHLTADAVTATAALILDWQVALSRRIDPRQPVVLSVGKVASGVTPNVIPGRAELEGTLRSLDPAIEDDLVRILLDVARGVEARTGTSVSVTSDRVVPAVVNDAGAAELMAQTVTAVLGREALVDAEPTLGGDDFAWYLHEVPGCYVFIGEQLEARAPYGWHDPGYDLDERALVMGSALMAGAVWRAAESEAR